MKIQAVLNPNGQAAEVSFDQAGESEQKSKAFASYLGEADKSYADSLDKIFDKAAKTYGVSKDLLMAMAKAESNFRSDAVSSVGAKGIMQLMPTTAASLGVTDSFDPEQNIMGGAKYISQLISKYGGRLSYAIAAYNAGSGNVDKYGGIPPFAETQAYVAKVLRYMESGVEVTDDQSDSAETGSFQSSSALNRTSGSAAEHKLAEALQDLMEKYFDYEDYLEFLQFFTKLLYEKATGKEISGVSSQQENSQLETVSEKKAAKDDDKTDQPDSKVLMMSVRSGGSRQVYRQDDSESETKTEAYKAYENMAFSNQNRIAVRLTPKSE